MAASILAGQAVGGEEIALARKTLRSCLIIALGYTALMVLLFTEFQDLVLAPFIRPDDSGQLEAIRISRCMLYFISGYLLIDSVNIVVSNALRGAGDTRFIMYCMTAVGILVFAIPCLVFYKLGFPWWSLWILLVAEIIVLCTLSCIRYRCGKWTKMRVIEVSAARQDDVV